MSTRWAPRPTRGLSTPSSSSSTTTVADTNAKARRRLGDYQQAIAHAANDQVPLLAEIGRVQPPVSIHCRAYLEKEEQ